MQRGSERGGGEQAFSVSGGVVPFLECDARMYDRLLTDPKEISVITITPEP